MSRLSGHEYKKLINILKKYKQYFSSSIEEDCRYYWKHIHFAKNNKMDISKAKIKLINTPKGPEIGVSFDE